MSNKHGGFNYRNHGVNSRGNHYCVRDYGNGSNSYHYSNRDRSYYYQNPDGSKYYNDGLGGSTYTAPNGKKYSSGYGNGVPQEDEGHDGLERPQYLNDESHQNSFSHGGSSSGGCAEYNRETEGQYQADYHNEYSPSCEPTNLSSDPHYYSESQNPCQDHAYEHDARHSVRDDRNDISQESQFDGGDHNQALSDADGDQSSCYDYDDLQPDERHDSGDGYDGGDYNGGGYDDGGYDDGGFDGGYDDDDYGYYDYDD